MIPSSELKFDTANFITLQRLEDSLQGHFHCVVKLVKLW